MRENMKEFTGGIVKTLLFIGLVMMIFLTEKKYPFPCRERLRREKDGC